MSKSLCTSIVTLCAIPQKITLTMSFRGTQRLQATYRRATREMDNSSAQVKFYTTIDESLSYTFTGTITPRIIGYSIKERVFFYLLGYGSSIISIQSQKLFRVITGTNQGERSYYLLGSQKLICLYRFGRGIGYENYYGGRVDSTRQN